MLISGKGKCFHVFGCISKNFPEKIFWCLEKKKENTNPEKHKPQPRKKIINDDKSSPTTAPSIAISPSLRDRDWRRDLAKARSRSSRDCAIDCDLVKKARSRSRYRSRSRHGGRTGNIFVVDDFFFPGLWLVFSDLCFPSSFPNNRKYFLENFLKCNQTHGNIFLFRKLAFPENMYFPENVLQQPNTALIMKLFAKR